MILTVGSLFSGVGGFEQGFEAAGFQTAWQCEIDQDASDVLARHWPSVRRYRDVRDVDPAELPPVDVVTFGSPCQDLSVAGKRAGLEGGRSGLFYEAVRIIRGVRPAFAVWENVPGAFSSNDGRDFGAVLAALAELGALDISWRVLDAQWFGVPQRRRRIFLVADFGGERAASVLFESEGMRGDSSASGKAGQGTAGDAEDGVGSGGVYSIQNGCRPREYSEGLGIAFNSPMYTLDTFGEHAVGVLPKRSVTGDGIAHAVTCPAAKGGDPTTDNYVVDLTNGTVSDGSGDAGTITTEQAHGNRGQFLIAPFDAAQISSKANQSRVEYGAPAPTRSGSARASVVGFKWQQGEDAGRLGIAEDASPTLGTTQVPAVGFTNRSEVTGTGAHETLRAASHGAIPMASHGMSVRRLTPRECERLMGWPDVAKSVTIHVCNQAQKRDNPEILASAETSSLRLPSSVLTAAESGSAQPVESADLISCTHRLGHGQRAVLNVSIDLERRVVETRNLSVSQPSAASAVTRLPLGGHPSSEADSVRALALISSILARTTPSGEAVSPPSMTPSTHQLSGSRCVVVSGHEITERAADVATASRMASELLTSTTLPVGRSSQNFDSILTTLCCFAIRAIGGSIPEPIQRASSYDCVLTLHSGWTQFRADGREVADGPRYRMCGNGVVAPVAEWIARRMRAALEATA